MPLRWLPSGGFFFVLCRPAFRNKIASEASECCLEPRPQPAAASYLLDGNTSHLGLGALRGLGARARLRELAGAEPHQADARRVLRPLDQLNDPLHAHRKPEPD